MTNWDDAEPTTVVDLDEVARLANARGVSCHVAHTSGGCATLRLGENLGTEDEPVYEVTAGPGNYSDRGSTIDLDDATLGTADDGTYPWSVGARTARDLADLAVLCWNARSHILDFDLLEEHGFDGNRFGESRRRHDR